MAFCANCGSSVDGRFCQKCGAPVGVPGPAPAAPGPTPGVSPVPQPPAPVGAPSVGMTDNMAGALCYLFGFITGILFLVLAPYNQDRNIRFHAFQSIFLSIAWVALEIVAAIVSAVLIHIPILGAIMTGLIYLVIGLGAFIMWLYMMFKTYNGEKIVLPVIGPMAEKQAGV
jgi:uncharacterized membrane protein